MSASSEVVENVYYNWLSWNKVEITFQGISDYKLGIFCGFRCGVKLKW